MFQKKKGTATVAGPGSAYSSTPRSDTLEVASTYSFALAQTSINELGRLMSAFTAQRALTIQPPSNFSKTMSTADGATVFTAQLSGGRATVTVPPEPDWLSRAGEFFGVSKKAPVTCVLSTQDGTPIVKLALEPSPNMAPAVRIASYGAYENVYHDHKNGGWIGSGPETQRALIAMIEGHGEQFQQDIHGGGPIWKGRGVPLQQRLRPEESIALKQALVVAEQVLSGNTDARMPRVIADSKAKGNVTPDINNIAAVTQDVTKLIATKDGAATLYSQYPNAVTSDNGGSVTFHDRHRDVTITISGPSYESLWQRVRSFITGASSEPRRCVVTRAGNEILKLGIDSDGKPHGIECAGYSNLDTDKQGFIVATDPVMRGTYRSLLQEIIPRTNPFNPLAVLKIVKSADLSNAPKRNLGSTEAEMLSGLLTDVCEVLNPNRVATRDRAFG